MRKKINLKLKIALPTSATTSKVNVKRANEERSRVNEQQKSRLTKAKKCNKFMVVRIVDKRKLMRRKANEAGDQPTNEPNETEVSGDSVFVCVC